MRVCWWKTMIAIPSLLVVLVLSMTVFRVEAEEQDVQRKREQEEAT